MNIKDIEGFTLLIEYPGCNKSVGYFERATTAEFLRYPKIWKPVYTKKYLRNEKLNEILNKNTQSKFR